MWYGEHIKRPKIFRVNGKEERGENGKGQGLRYSDFEVEGRTLFSRHLTCSRHKVYSVSKTYYSCAQWCSVCVPSVPATAITSHSPTMYLSLYNSLHRFYTYLWLFYRYRGRCVRQHSQKRLSLLRALQILGPNFPPRPTKPLRPLDSMKWHQTCLGDKTLTYPSAGHRQPLHRPIGSMISQKWNAWHIPSHYSFGPLTSL